MARSYAAVKRPPAPTSSWPSPPAPAGGFARRPSPSRVETARPRPAAVDLDTSAIKEIRPNPDPLSPTTTAPPHPTTG